MESEESSPLREIVEHLVHWRKGRITDVVSLKGNYAIRASFDTTTCAASSHFFHSALLSNTNGSLQASSPHSSIFSPLSFPTTTTSPPLPPLPNRLFCLPRSRTSPPSNLPRSLDLASSGVNRRQNSQLCSHRRFRPSETRRFDALGHVEERTWAESQCGGDEWSWSGRRRRK